MFSDWMLDIASDRRTAKESFRIQSESIFPKEKFSGKTFIKVKTARILAEPS